MAYLTVNDLYSRIYQENLNEITRDDESLAIRAIDAAIEEAKSYLDKYDLVALFGYDAPALDNSSDESKAPTVNSTFLKNIVVDIATWNLVKLGNANIDFQLSKDEYSNARSKLKDIQKGMAKPEGWPYRDTTNDTAPKGDYIHKTSNPKRNQFF